MTQPTTATTTNKSLFSRHYLENHLPALPEWQEDARAAFAALAPLWERGARLGADWKEAQTEAEFIEKAFTLLDWAYMRQVRAARGGLMRPDYALFLDAGAKDEAYGLKDNEDAFYGRVAAIAEVKHWGRSLSQRSADGRDVWDAQTNPSHQMVSYLAGTRSPWGILTNGVTWRLYSGAASSKATEFYEVDLGAIFDAPEAERLDRFKLWWLFFRRDAFIPDAQGRNFVQRVALGSATYARQVSDKLKDLVYREVMPELAGGFIAYRREQRGITEETPESLADVYRASLSLLYKLLFILYAEARRLLPVDNPAYREDSLTRMAQEFADKRDRALPFSEETHATPRYDALRSLFNRIDRGDRRLGVPRYDGGLFNPNTPENRFLAEHRLSDCAVARAVDVLVRDAGEPVDYGYISVRNLGSIYEGLLENRLELEPAAEGPRVLLVNDRGERKATGSYYTPDYIVDYIVRETLAPVLAERGARFEAAMLQVARAEARYRAAASPGAQQVASGGRAAAKRAAREAFLSIKVCDPAMGSGHFLVSAVDFLTDGIIQRMQQFHDAHPEAPWQLNPIRELIDAVRDQILAEMARQGITVDPRRLDDTALLTRLVMKRCVYGVDLNRMAVELAKLSLWLDSFTVGAPLSFLDHHLRWGNSLIGSDIRSMEAAIAVTDAGQLALWKGPFSGLLDLTSVMLQVADRSDATLADVRQSAEEFEALQKSLTPYKQALDLWVSRHFDNMWALALITLHGDHVLDALRGERTLDQKQRETVEKARALWAEKRFFHWDLEFPEVFVDLERRDWAENPGFDAVIGNPPYDELSEDALGREIEERAYLTSNELYREAVTYRINLYRLFIALAVSITRKGGYQSFIVPMSLLGDRFTRDLRRSLLTQTDFQLIEAFPQKDNPQKRVFLEAKLPTCLYVLKQQPPQTKFRVRTHPAGEIEESSPAYYAGIDDIAGFDPDNFTIPMVDEAAWELAIRLSRGARVTRLAEIATPMVGEVIFNKQFRSYLSDDPRHTLVLRGGHVQRYELIDDPKQGSPVYIDKERWLAEARPGTNAFDHLKARIVYQEVAPLDNWRRIIATYLPAGNVCGHTISYFVDPHYDPYALLAMFNSRVIEWRFRLASMTNHVSSYQVAVLPVPKIQFTTPPADRTRLAADAQRLYEQHAAGGDAAPVLAFVDAQLAAGRSDVTHDLLAHLAGQMIALNRNRQSETRGFLAWLGREIGAPVDTLGNKTALENYAGDYQKGEGHASLEAVLRVLKANRRRLAVDPAARAFQEGLAGEYEGSLARLLPLKARLERTDRLIDRVVYRLYGLGPEDIAIIEG